jgi:predicted porin
LYAKYESGSDFSASLGFNPNTNSDRLVVGAKHKISPSMETYSEYRSQELTGSHSAETATGFRGSVTVEKGLTVTPALEVVKVSKGEMLQDSLAASVSVKDVRDTTNKKYLRAEIRQSENDDYYALEGNYIKRLDDVWSAYAGEKLRINKSDQDGTNGSHELTFGLAQRQRDKGKHNGLYLYQWKERRGAGENADSSTHILSTHQNYRVNEAISISGRVGGKLHTSQIEGRDHHSDTALFDGKASYALNDKVDVYARGGVIASDHFNEQQYSAGIGANMTIDRNLRVGVGYNNSGFNDKDLDPDKQNKDGFFVNLILKADETLFDWLSWKKKKREVMSDNNIKAGYIPMPMPKATVTYQR